MTSEEVGEFLERMIREESERLLMAGYAAPNRDTALTFRNGRFEVIDLDAREGDCGCRGVYHQPGCREMLS